MLDNTQLSDPDSSTTSLFFEGSHGNGAGFHELMTATHMPPWEFRHKDYGQILLDSQSHLGPRLGDPIDYLCVLTSLCIGIPAGFQGPKVVISVAQSSVVLHFTFDNPESKALNWEQASAFRNWLLKTIPALASIPEPYSYDPAMPPLVEIPPDKIKPLLAHLFSQKAVNALNRPASYLPIDELLQHTLQQACAIPEATRADYYYYPGEPRPGEPRPGEPRPGEPRQKALPLEPLSILDVSDFLKGIQYPPAQTEIRDNKRWPLRLTSLMCTNNYIYWATRLFCIQPASVALLYTREEPRSTCTDQESSLWEVHQKLIEILPAGSTLYLYHLGSSSGEKPTQTVTIGKPYKIDPLRITQSEAPDQLASRTQRALQNAASIGATPLWTFPYEHNSETIEQNANKCDSDLLGRIYRAPNSTINIALPGGEDQGSIALHPNDPPIILEHKITSITVSHNEEHSTPHELSPIQRRGSLFTLLTTALRIGERTEKFQSLIKSFTRDATTIEIQVYTDMLRKHHHALSSGVDSTAGTLPSQSNLGENEVGGEAAAAPPDSGCKTDESVYTISGDH